MDGPRENDHLVEPLFAGLEDVDEIAKDVNSIQVGLRLTIYVLCLAAMGVIYLILR
jgi:hypothetical protein